MKYKRAIIIGGGHSTHGFDWTLLENEFTFGINYSFKLLEPTCLVLDNDRFYEENKKQIDELNSVKLSHHCNKKGIIHIPGTEVFYGKNSLINRKIYTYKLTGIYTLTLATCLEFEEIYLLGYDMNAKNGQLHNPDLKHPHNSLLPYRPQISKFENFWGIPGIFNVSPNSAIDVFPKMNYNEFISILKRDPLYTSQDEARQWLKNKLDGEKING